MTERACINCDHWRLKESNLAALGFGLCDKERPPFRGARSFSQNAICQKTQFVAAPEQVIVARVEYFKKMESKK